MAFTIILTYSKEDPLVDWYPEPADVTNVINDYKAAGKITSLVEEDIDGLTRKRFEKFRKMGNQTIVPPIDCAPHEFN